LSTGALFIPLFGHCLAPSGSAPGAAWVWAFGIYDPAGQLGAFSSKLPKLPFPKRVARRAKTRSVSPLSAKRWIAAAIQLWQEHARSRQQLRELSDHLLKDIGLRRDDVAYEFSKPFRDLD
jgi:uncharacterized protein YjiS (DUF1127 family)